MPEELVLISGVNGYIAAILAKHLLEQGYHVRGTVRKITSANELVEGPLKDYYVAGKFQIVEVPDITVDGAFDKAVKGVTAIAHLASPVSMDFKDPAPILRTAVQGTNTILKSAQSHAGSQLQSVVVLSSIAAVKNATPAPYTFTETDWNDIAEAICEQKGTDTPGGLIYAASKVAAEKAFWQFQKEVQPAFSMTSINPVFVVGPSLISPRTPAEVGGTLTSIYRVFAGTSGAGAIPGITQIVDVRDVAQLVGYAIAHPRETNLERYIASSSVNHPQAVADILREEFDNDQNVLERILPGERGKGYASDYHGPDEGGYKVDSSKARKLLEGGDWIPYRKSIIDTAATFVGLI